MTDPNSQNPGDEKQIPIQDVVLSNSWALQSILLYLEEQNPGARDRIWQIYQQLQPQDPTSQPNTPNDITDPENN
jgi:hypothetical protein